MNEKMSKTIAEQLNIKEFPFSIRDKNGNEIYFEDSKGYWEKREYDFYGNKIYYENSDGYSARREYDSDDKLIYYENSDDEIIDKRPKDRAIKLLRDLADLQNGAPLEEYRKEWEETMEQVHDFLNKWESQ